MTNDTIPVTPRTRVGRLRDRQVLDRAALDAVLDSGLVAHVASCRDGEPVLLPMAYARDGDRLLLHGSTGGGLLRLIGSGAPVAVAVTHVDGMVFARSIFDSSMNYRSAVIFGTAGVLEGEEKVEALRALTERLMPGRWDEVRPATRAELAKTMVLEVPITEASVKVRDAGVLEEGPEDPAQWAGVVPLAVTAGAPVDHDGLDPSVEVAPSVRAFVAARAG